MDKYLAFAYVLIIGVSLIISMVLLPLPEQENGEETPPEPPRNGVLLFSVVTDSHTDSTIRSDLYRHLALSYLETVSKDSKAAGAEFIVHLGDLIDANPRDMSVDIYINRILSSRQALEKSGLPVYYVIGNHELRPAVGTKTLAKQWLGLSNSYYSFDIGGFHFIVLDCFNYEGDEVSGSDETWESSRFLIYSEEKAWLENELARTNKPTIVFVHVPLSGMFEPYTPDGSTYNRVINAPEIRELFENSRKVIAVFEGHYHNPHTEVITTDSYTWKEGNVPYIGLYSVVDIDDIGTWALVEVNYNEKTLTVKVFGAKPHVWTFSWNYFSVGG